MPSDLLSRIPMSLRRCRGNRLSGAGASAASRLCDVRHRLAERHGDEDLNFIALGAFRKQSRRRWYRVLLACAWIAVLAPLSVNAQDQAIAPVPDEILGGVLKLCMASNSALKTIH
jgi:hypothetical protein